MKKTLSIIIGFIALSIFISIIKITFFKNNDENFYNQGWDAYEKKDYNSAIILFNKIDSKKYPDVLGPIADSYMEIGDYENAIQNFEKVYKSNTAINTENYPSILNNLGLCYMLVGKLKEARFFLEKSYNLGNKNSSTNLNKLDSLEIKQSKENAE